LDFAGNILWQKNLQKEYAEDTLWWDLGTSPVLTRDHVVIAVVQSGPSFLVAFDKRSGEPAWKVDRLLDAPEEAAQTYATPLVVGGPSEQRIVVLGADHVTEHDALNGAELWRVGGMNPEQDRFFRSIASPAIAGEMIIAPYARGQTITAIRRGGQGDVTSSHVAWTKQRMGADVPTPAVHEGRVYFCTDRGQILALDPQSGDVLWTHQLSRSSTVYSASPVIAQGMLYATREDGTTFVVNISSNPPQDVGQGTLAETTIASPVLVDGRILIKTFENLYCLGN
jgi:outer membrane protein assembly factor BamB